MKRNLDWLPALAFAAFGGTYLYASLQVAEAFSGGYGHRTVPLAMSVLVLCLSAWLLVSRSHDVAEPRSADGSGRIHLEDFAARSCPLIVLMAVYGLCQTWFGYIAATLICGTAAFRLFGNSWIASLLHGAAGTAVLYALFFILLNLYEPPGSVFDLTGLF